MTDLICKISKTDPKIVFELERKGKARKRLEIMPTIGLDSMLIALVDKFLKENRIGLSSIDNIKVKGSVSPHSSSHKILLAFIEALKA